MGDIHSRFTSLEAGYVLLWYAEPFGEIGLPGPGLGLSLVNGMISQVSLTWNQAISSTRGEIGKRGAREFAHTLWHDMIFMQLGGGTQGAKIISPLALGAKRGLGAHWYWHIDELTRCRISRCIPAAVGIINADTDKNSLHSVCSTMIHLSLASALWHGNQ
ncbi:MAG: hypothetical protein O7D91_15955 [Planctomycetota bacterium]|nr:hypothetical protein [Planctomycetota bacterium]